MTTGSQLPTASGPAPSAAPATPTTPEELAEVWRSAREPAGSGPKRGRRHGRRPMGTLVRVGGLLMVLLTIAIMGVLGVRVLSGLTSADIADPSAGLAPADGPGAISDTADSRACDAGRGAIELAVQTYTVTFGDAPLDQQALVDAGILDAASPDFEVLVIGEGVSVRGIGPCEGR